MSAMTNDGMLNRLLAMLADVPEGRRPQFARIAHDLKVTATEVTVGVWQLASMGRIDRDTLRPARPKALFAVPAEPETRRQRASLCASLVWCGQCDRRVGFERALGCRSSFCKAEIPPAMRECPL
jgi:hypothetical protein